MKITLEKLSVKNFKGIEKFNLKLDGKSATIAGTNGLGKSTIADAWYWLISGKDTELQAGFDILPLDVDNNMIDHVDAEVEACISIDDKKMKLKKKHKQKWTKKRGRAEAEYTGQTTEHFLDDVPASQREYQDELAKIIPDIIFRILSDVRYFCAATKPDDRRNMLIDMCGEVLPENIIAANPDLAELDSILTERDLESHKKILSAKRKKINQRLDRIPDLINELRDTISDVSKYDEIELRQQESEMEDKIKEKLVEMGNLVSGIELDNFRDKLRELGMLEQSIEREMREETDYHIDKLLADKTNLSQSLIELEHENVLINGHMDSIKKDIISNEALRVDLMKMWKKSNEDKLDDLSVCFNCGQELPNHMIEEQRDKFNLQKAEKLRQINEKGMDLLEAFEAMNTSREKLFSQLLNRTEDIKNVKEDIERIDDAIHKVNNEVNSKYARKQGDIAVKIFEIKEKIAGLEQDIEPEKERLKTHISKLEDDKDVIKSKLLEITHSEKTRKRIAELTAEQKDLAREWENSERELWLIEEYGRRRSELIESNVSEHFAITKWKLFEIQQNKGIRDVCEPLIGGIPYSTNLNNGARILCGMDCINAISKHLDIDCPVFIDNSESLKKWIDFPHQHIRLEATLDDELKVTIEKK